MPSAGSRTAPVRRIGPPSHATAATLTDGVSDMGASRLVSIILLLQARGPMTAEQLAAELEVPVCTIYRDADSLDHPLLCPDQRGSAQ
jgi:hypothetical protein